MPYNIAVVRRAEFEESERGTYQFIDAIADRLDTHAGTHKKHSIFSTSNDLVVIQKVLQVDGDLPDFLVPIKEYLDPDSRSGLKAVLVETGSEVDQRFYPLRHPILGDPQFRVPYVRVAYNNLEGDMREIPEAVRQQFLIYSPRSETPLSVFSKNDLSELKAAFLPPLSVTSIDDVVNALPEYHRLYDHMKRDIKVLKCPGHKDSMLGIKGAVLFCSVVKDNYYFNQDGWFLLYYYQGDTPYLYGSNAKEVLEAIEKNAPYGVSLCLPISSDKPKKIAVSSVETPLYSLQQVVKALQVNARMLVTN